MRRMNNYNDIWYFGNWELPALLGNLMSQQNDNKFVYSHLLETFY